MTTKTKDTDGVYVSRPEYERLVADAQKWRRLHARVVDYHSSLPKEKRPETMNAYAKWARENMKASA